MSRASPDTTSPPSQQDQDLFYPIKWILDSQNIPLPICMQARNGPCALLALININLQKRAFTLEPGTTRMPEHHLIAILADHIATNPSPSPARQTAISDFLDMLPLLNRGMHINLRFSSPTAFEFTRELSVFDVFPDVRLLHGWLVDPQDVPLAAALGSLSYNQVIDELVRTASPPPPPPPEEPLPPDALRHIPSAPPPEAFEDALSQPVQPELQPESQPEPTPHTSSQSVLSTLPEESQHTTAIREIRPFVVDFLQSNPTQLTVYGLTELHDTLDAEETAILFRNSHFYVIRKHAGELYTLITDVGYLNELNTVWEKLSDVNGDSTFYNGSFCRLAPNGSVVPQPPSTPPPPNIAPAQTQPRPPYSARPLAPGPSIRRRPMATARASAEPRVKNSDKCSVQ